jgi:hypothetical protein
VARLKVFRTAIGFHDAYVAAPSRKAALEAWGAQKDLFAVGSAELVEDPKLTAEPLASPGKVIKRVRGSLADHLSAAAKTEKRSRPRAEPPAKRAPRPRPSRDALSQAEAALEEARGQAKAEAAELERREAALREERRGMEARHSRELAKLEAKAERARERYDEAMERWRAD